MKKYFKLSLGEKSKYAEECFKGNYVGVDVDFDLDLTGKFLDNWRDFNKKFIPVYLRKHPEKPKVYAGLVCATIWLIFYDCKNGDIIVSPDPDGYFHVAEITGDYEYHKGENLPHRRPVQWLDVIIDRNAMSESLRNYTRGGLQTNLTGFAEEIEQLIGGKTAKILVSNDETIEDPTVFALEKHLEDFLVSNWKHTLLGKEYDVFEVEGELVGQQYQTDTGPIDVLAISKDKKTLLIVELKKGRASDIVVGQIQRYMGYVKDELAEDGQKVKGVIIALEDDLKMRRALSVTNDIEFYRYEVNFKLKKDNV